MNHKVIQEGFFNDVHSRHIYTEYEDERLKELEGKAFDPSIQENIVEYVSQVIKESSSIVNALEAVGAMYCIPASHFMRDNNVKGIQLNGANIVAPDLNNPGENVNAITRSISALLDNISKRIDDKVDMYQLKTMKDNKRLANQKPVNPHKGKVKERVYDDEDNEIVIYDSGMIDFNPCDSSRRKIEELRAQGRIPENSQPVGSSYFTEEEDDITSDIDSVSSADMSENDMSSNIGEYTAFIRLCEAYDHTRNLGYELMTEQGFKGLQPTDVIMESSKVSTDKKLQGSVSDISHMRFDNKHIVNAINLINDAVKDQKVVKASDISFKDLFDNDKTKKALDELSDQLDARICIKYKDGPRSLWNVYTVASNFDSVNNYNEITLSKTKGFQLGGNKIVVNIIGDCIPMISGDTGIEYIGQTIISILMHEIFHQIIHVWRLIDSSFMAALTSTIALASSMKKVKSRRICITNYVNALDNFMGKKLSIITKRTLIKHLIVVSSVCYDDKKLNKYRQEIASNDDKSLKPSDEDINKQIDKSIKIYEKALEDASKSLKIGKKVASGIIGAGMIISQLFSEKAKVIGSIGIIIMAGSMLSITGRVLFRSAMNEYAEMRDYEEQNCDMFASMYQLPPVFRLVINERLNIVPNDVSDIDRLKKFSKVDIALSKVLLDIHPSSMERNRDAVKCANAMLEAGGDLLDPSIKKYLEWIVENFSSSLDADIDEIYNKTVFDPHMAEDIDKHMQSLITDADVKVED